MYNSNSIDSLNTDYVAGRKTVTSAGYTTASSGVSPLSGRQTLLIYNTSTTVTVYFGPSGFTAGGSSGTGIPIGPLTLARVDFGPLNSVFLRTETGSADVIIQEAS